jgi:hypothetical protein
VILAIVLVCLELLQEAETGRSGGVPRSAVLGHAETLLAAMRHLITNESCGPNFSHPESRRGAKLHAVRRNYDQVRKDSLDRQKARGGNGQSAKTECCVC